MIGMVYRGPGRIGAADVPEPGVLGSRDAIVRVTLSAICTSDLHIRDGLVPRAVPGTVLGHEFVGVVEAAGDGAGLRPGDRVAASCETWCGVCFFCRRGEVNCCTHPDGGWALGCRIDGGQAERVRVPFADLGLSRIPDDVADRQALLTGDLLSTGLWAADIGGVSEGDAVAVLGAGPTGVCCALMCKAAGARVILVDIDPSRLEFSEGHGVADEYLQYGDGLESEVLALTDGLGADVVMDVAGTTGSFESAWRIARPCGTVVLVAMYGEPQTLPLPDMYGKNLTIRFGGVHANRCGEILGMISDGRIDASFLVTHEFPASEMEEAYALFSERRDGVMKVAIRFSDAH